MTGSMTWAGDIGVKETREVMELLREKYGDDFNDFSLTIFVRRLGVALEKLGLPTAQALRNMLQRGNRSDYDRFLWALLPKTTELFRDPSFWRCLRDRVLPEIAKRAGERFTVWQAALDSGEELFSLLILLQEGGYEGCTVYCSYLGERMLRQSSSGYLPIRATDIDSANFMRCQLRGQFSDYVREVEGHREFTGAMLPRVRYVSQGPEFIPLETEDVSLVLCRNQLLYFNPKLCSRNLDILSRSLRQGGYLAIGVQERLVNLHNCSNFTLFTEQENIYRRS